MVVFFLKKGLEKKEVVLVADAEKIRKGGRRDDLLCKEGLEKGVGVEDWWSFVKERLIEIGVKVCCQRKAFNERGRSGGLLPSKGLIREEDIVVAFFGMRDWRRR